MQFVITSNYTEGEIENIDRGLRFLLMTRRGTYPLDREFGTSQDYIDMPGPLAVTQLAAELPDLLLRYEPRIQLDHIDLEQDSKTGLSESVLYFRQSDDIEEEEEEEEEDFE